MPSADISYHQPSRGSRALVVGLSVGVVLLATWIVVANREALHVPGLAAVPAPEPIQAVEVQTPAPAEAVVAAPAEPPTPEPVVTAETDPPVPEPVVVASADETPPLRPTVVAAPVIEPEVTGSTDVKFGPDEVVPLPHKRPQLKMTAALPVPRPRPDLGDAVPVSTGRELTNSEIERMR